MLNSLKQLHWSIYALSLGSCIIMAGFTMMLPILPRYTEELSFNEFEIGLLVAAFFIGRVTFQFPLGVFSDRLGRKIIMAGSLFVFALVTTLLTFTTTAWVMIALRLFQGFSSAGFVVGFQAYVNDMTPIQYRGLAHGINSSAINAGIILGPVIGGTVSEAYSIQTPFFIGGLLGACCFLLSLTIPRVRSHETAAGITSLKPSGMKFRTLLSKVLTPPAFSLSLIHFLQMMSLAILFAAAPILTAELLSWSSADIAFALALSGAAGIISSPFLGRLADRRGGRVWVMSAGLTVLAFESLVIYLHPGTAMTLIGFIVGGAGAPAYFNAFFSLVGDITQRKERGAVSGFIGSTAEWGSIIGSSLVAPLLWREVGVQAPMGVSVLLLISTVLVALMARQLLQRRTELVMRLDS